MQGCFKPFLSIILSLSTPASTTYWDTYYNPKIFTYLTLNLSVGFKLQRKVSETYMQIDDK